MLTGNDCFICVRALTITVFMFVFIAVSKSTAGGPHTTYSRNNMGQKCEGNCGLWVLNEIIKTKYPENLKKLAGAVRELPAM
jgi:hypothetical protein